MKTNILACGSYLPPTKIRPDDIFSDIQLEKKYGIPDNWMSQTMGIEEMREAPIGTKPSALAIKAGEKALAANPHINPDEIGLVIFCGIERDQPEPATAHTVNDELGLNASHAFDVSNACFGFIDGMQIASNFVRCDVTKYVLVVTGEAHADIKLFFAEQLKTGMSQKNAQEILGFFSAGDAGGAVIVGASENDISGFELFNNVTASKHRDKCYYEKTRDGRFKGKMVMGQVAARGFGIQKNLMVDTMTKLGWSDFDWLLTHQIGREPFKRIEALNIIKPERMIKTFDRLGNLTSATFAVCYDMLLSNSEFKTGDRIGCSFSGSGLVAGQVALTA